MNYKVYAPGTHLPEGEYIPKSALVEHADLILEHEALKAVAKTLYASCTLTPGAGWTLDDEALNKLGELLDENEKRDIEN